MDYNTFVYALSDIANTLYGEYFHSVTQAREYRGEAQAFSALIRCHLCAVDADI
jgi:hypothetical protein